MGLLDFGGIGTGDAPNGAAQGGGLMGMFANPQTAGLLGMAGGLLQAAGPSRIPVTMGQAMGAGLSGMGQGVGNAFQTQMQMARMNSMMNPFGTPASSGATAPASASVQMPPVMDAANTGGLSGISAGMGISAPSASDASASAVSAYPGGAAPTGPMIMGHTPQEWVMAGYRASALGNPAGAEMMKLGTAFMTPTDTMKVLGAAYGVGTPEYQAALSSYANHEANPLVAGRAGAPMYDSRGNVVSMAPKIPDNAIPIIKNGQVTGVTALPGASGVVQGNAAAHAAGEGSQLPYSGVDAQGNPLPVTNRTAAATQGGNLPLPLRNNNPGAVSPGGQVASYPDLQTGLQKMDENLAGYAGLPDARTLGAVITKWVGSPPNAPAYIKDVTGRLGIGANTPVDLTNPAQRQAIATAIMLHENGPGAVFRSGQGDGGAIPASSGGSAPAANGGGAIYAQPPLGTQANAEAQAKGQVDTMNASYKEARQARATGQYALTMLDDMSNFAQTKSPALANKLYNVQGIFSSDAQLFGKARDNLVTQVSSSTGMNTDAARAIVDGAIPSYGMNPQAIQTGLGQIKAQVQMRMLKGDYLSDAYANGDAPAYNQRENQFDQMMTPTAAAIIKMPPGMARNQAIAAAKNNSQDAHALRWGLNVGLLH